MPWSAGGHKAACRPQVRVQTSVRQRFCAADLRKRAKTAKIAGPARVSGGPAGLRTGPGAAGRGPGRPKRPARQPDERRGRRSGAGAPGAPRLAARAEERRALALDDAPDRRAAGAAGLARAVVDQELVAVGARLVPQRAVRAERGAEARDRLVQHRDGLGGDRVPLFEADCSGLAPRIHARAVQDLARIDVADAGDALLVEEEGFHAELEVLGLCLELVAGGWGRDWIGAERGDGFVAR